MPLVMGEGEGEGGGLTVAGLGGLATRAALSADCLLLACLTNRSGPVTKTPSPKFASVLEMNFRTTRKCRWAPSSGCV